MKLWRSRVLICEHKDSRCFPRPHPKNIREQFIISHYAAEVTYTVGHFLDKNNDTTPVEVEALMSDCGCEVVKEIFEAEGHEATAHPAHSREFRRGVPEEDQVRARVDLVPVGTTSRRKASQRDEILRSRVRGGTPRNEPCVHHAPRANLAR